MMLSTCLIHYSHDFKLVLVHKIPVFLGAKKLASFLSIHDADLVTCNDGKESVTCVVARAKLLLNKWL